MTEEKIEQKADKYADNEKPCDGQAQLYIIDGYVAGYHECQKEHEWHYVKDELPTYNGQFYVALKGYKETFILNYDYNETDNMSWLDDDDTNFDDEVYAWCEKLKAPKEIE